MSYVLEFELPGLPKTTNSAGRAHWAIKAREARVWSTAVHNALLASRQVPQTPFKKARLTLTRISSACPDPDGLVSSFKHVIDGLVTAGVLVNDKFENIGMPDYRWEKGPHGKGRIKVKVEEQNGP